VLRYNFEQYWQYVSLTWVVLEKISINVLVLELSDSSINQPLRKSLAKFFNGTPPLLQLSTAYFLTLSLGSVSWATYIVSYRQTIFQEFDFQDGWMLLIKILMEIS
jgi:ABC-type amino acid transport system permease subunit